MEKLLQHWLTEQAEKQPDDVAVVMGERKLTYGMLETQSNRLAHLLKDRKCLRRERICILMPKSPESIISIFGVLKADAIYVPLDSEGPVSRTEKMIRKSRAKWILASGKVEHKLLKLLASDDLNSSISIGWMSLTPPDDTIVEKLDFTASDLQNYPDCQPEYRNRLEDPAHILFTSGSTGEPKGVINTHANDMHFVDWGVRYFGITSRDRLSCHSPLHFDLSGFDIHAAISAGAELHLVPPKINILPNLIADFIRVHRLTQWFSVPSVLTLMANLDVVQEPDFPDLKRILWCGEALPTSSIVYFMKRLPHVRFTNLYGPTETTIASSYYTVPKCPDSESEDIPIGTACDGEQLHVLDVNNRPVKNSETGHLYITGKGVSPGYWEDPEITNSVFLPNPFSADPTSRIYKTGDLASIREDGQVRFHGREDDQIKSRGYRIELGEIEHALHSLNVTLECAIVALPSDQIGSKIIGCAYVPVNGSPVESKDLRRKLSEALPAYMVPVVWKKMPALPKNKNGKIDRNMIIDKILNNASQTTENK